MVARGTVLDANMMFDLCVLNEWHWISTRYGPLITSSLVWNELDVATKQSASAHVKRVELSEAELQCVSDLGAEFGGILSLSDRSAIAVALKRSMRCGSNERALYAVCRAKGVESLRGLRILKDMNSEGYMSAAQCLRAVQRMREESNMWITDQVVSQWAKSLR